MIGRIDELQRGEFTFEDIAADPVTLRAETHISGGVGQLETEHQGLALVRDADGESVFEPVTATDALETGMGEIEESLDVKFGERAAQYSGTGLRD